jgi:hypothetical protein
MAFVEVANKFFDLIGELRVLASVPLTSFRPLEHGKGSKAIEGFLKPNSSQRFESQTAALADIHDIRSYADWMAVLCSGITPDAHYDLHNVAVDEKKRTVIFFATFHGTHTGDKGPVKATKKSCESHYVYVVRFDAEKDVIVVRMHFVFPVSFLLRSPRVSGSR